MDVIPASFVPDLPVSPEDVSNPMPGDFIKAHWTEKKFRFVCECGKVKTVKEKK